ncbi:calcium-activated potassium channel subunit beta-3 [Cottoperca gobio]|uniref:Calcium-activated potassium channel subunit beta-3 n=1 Tax=Cottoperca gobio TaxID=56716 RepID=A0A6J2RGD5_COTGO|nr:calcium-activated potassium channel subunit beta-3-like [Cottoperca gobio]
MFLNTASPRRSSTVPVNINLQGARRRQTRTTLTNRITTQQEVYIYSWMRVTAQEQEWSRGLDERGGQQRVRTQTPVSSVGEDRALLLGFTMMAFSVLMFFVVSITMVKPYVNSNWEEKVRCVLLQADILEQWVDCRGVSNVPCLRVTVNLSDSNQRAFLHFDEESVLLAPEVGIYGCKIQSSFLSQCFYVPKCHMDRTELEDEVLKVKCSLDAQLGITSACFTDRTGHPGDVILSRKYTFKKTVFVLLWPCLMLGGGALLVGLVKLTQCLAHLSAEICSEAAVGRLTSRYTLGKLYRLLWRSSMQSPS